MKGEAVWATPWGLYTENDVRLSRFILLDEREKRKARQDFWGEKISVDFNKLRVRKGRFKIKVC